jgi:hypothetical protein
MVLVLMLSWEALGNGNPILVSSRWEGYGLWPVGDYCPTERFQGWSR